MSENLSADVINIERDEEELLPFGAASNDEVERQIVDHVLGVKHRSETFYASRRSRWLDGFDHYTNKKRRRTRTTIPVPIASEHVDIMLADVISRQIANRPLVGVRGRNESDQLRAPAVEKLINYQLQKEDSDGQDIFDKMYTSYKQAFMYGSGPFRVVHDVDYFEIPVPGSANDVKLIEYAGPTIITYDLFDYFPDTNKVRPNDAATTVVRMFRPFEYLEERADNFPNIYRNISKIPHKRSASISNDQIDHRQHRQSVLGMSPEATMRNLIEIYEADVWWPVKRKNGTYIRKPFVFTVANGQLVRASRNNMVSQDGNVGLAILDRLPNDLFGIGLVEKIHPQIHGANTVLDMILTNLELTVDKIKVYSEDQVKRPNQLVNNFAGAAVAVKGDARTAVAWQDGGSIVTDAYIMQQFFQVSAEAGSGVKPIKQGQVSKQTATATLQASKEAGIRFNLPMMLLERTFLKFAAERMHMINQQFLDLPIAIPVLEDDVNKIQQVDAQTIAMQPDFVVEGAAREINKQMEVAQIENFLGIVSRVPELHPIIPSIIGKLARAFRWEEADKIQDLAQQAIEQALFLRQLQQQAELANANNEGGTSTGGGSTGPGNMAGLEATNEGALNQALMSSAGPSTFS